MWWDTNFADWMQQETEAACQSADCSHGKKEDWLHAVESHAADPISY